MNSAVATARRRCCSAKSKDCRDVRIDTVLTWRAATKTIPNQCSRALLMQQTCRGPFRRFLPRWETCKAVHSSETVDVLSREQRSSDVPNSVREFQQEAGPNPLSLFPALSTFSLLPSSLPAFSASAGQPGLPALIRRCGAADLCGPEQRLEPVGRNRAKLLSTQRHVEVVRKHFTLLPKSSLIHRCREITGKERRIRRRKYAECHRKLIRFFP